MLTKRNERKVYFGFLFSCPQWVSHDFSSTFFKDIVVTKMPKPKATR